MRARSMFSPSLSRALPLALGLVLVLAAGALAQTPITVSFDPPAGEFECNDTLVVSIVVDAAAVDLRGFSLEIGYDETIVEPIAVTAGDLLVGAACDHFVTWIDPGNDGTLEVDGATLGCSVAGPGSIVSIEFAGVGEGSSPLECLSGILRDGDNATLDYTCVPGTIQWTCPVPVEARAWGELKAIHD